MNTRLWVCIWDDNFFWIGVWNGTSAAYVSLFSALRNISTVSHSRALYAPPRVCKVPYFSIFLPVGCFLWFVLLWLVPAATCVSLEEPGLGKVTVYRAWSVTLGMSCYKAKFPLMFRFFDCGLFYFSYEDFSTSKVVTIAMILDFWNRREDKPPFFISLLSLVLRYSNNKKIG